MKKKLCIVLIAVMLLAVSMPTLSACTSREDTLKIYNCAEYIGEDVIDQFKEYYKSVTGKNISIVYDEYDTNETMHSKVAIKKSDYDVICASDYMIERMLREELLLEQSPLGDDLDGNPIEDYRKSNISSYFLDNTVNNFTYDPSGKYSTPYMWGTMGIVYATDAVSLEYLESKGWGALWDPAYQGRVNMKKSVRDTYAVGAIYTFCNQSSANFDANITPEMALNNVTNASAVQQSLVWQKQNVKCGYETDEGKSAIIEGKVDMALQWSGDAIYSMGELQEELGISRSLDYYVPQEGSNVWVDCWAIPKYAKNTVAANLWINFLCQEDIAIENMEWIGYTSCVATQATFDWCQGYYDDNDEFVAYTEEDYEPSDLSYFFGGELSEQAKSIIVDPVQFPSLDVVKRCGVMSDFGEENTKIIDSVWANVLNA